MAFLAFLVEIIVSKPIITYNNFQWQVDKLSGQNFFFFILRNNEQSILKLKQKKWPESPPYKRDVK